MNRTILTSVLAIFVSLTASSQVSVVAGEHWGALNCFFTIEHYNPLGDLVSSHTATLVGWENIPSMEVEEGDRLRLMINEFRPDGNTVVDKNYSIQYDSDYSLVATTEREVNRVAIVLDKEISMEEGLVWFLD